MVRCICNCHSAAARKVMDLEKHKTCVECRRAIGNEKRAMWIKVEKRWGISIPRIRKSQGN